MPSHLVFTRESLRFLSKQAQWLCTQGNAAGVASFNLTMLLLIAALPLAQLSTRYQMLALCVVCGPLQLLRSIPYDIRVFILTHSRVSFAILHSAD